MVADEATVIAACRAYFDGLWRRAGADLSHDTLDSWEESVAHHCDGWWESQSRKGTW